MFAELKECLIDIRTKRQLKVKLFTSYPMNEHFFPEMYEVFAKNIVSIIEQTS